MDFPKPQAEHQWLERLVGEWTTEMEAAMGPDQPVQKFLGKETVRSLGGLWFLCEATPDGGTGTTLMTLGFDPKKGRYVGSFVGSMMTYQWVYDGTVNAEGTKLTLDTFGPNFTVEGKMNNFKDSIEFLSDDHRTLTSAMQNDKGEFVQFMTMHYHRVK